MSGDAALIDFRPPETATGRRRITLDDLYAMMREGIVEEGERSELIDGELFVMASEGELHVDYTTEFYERLREALGPDFVLQMRGVLNRPPDTQLSPDIAVWPKGTRFRGMTPENVKLIIEISDTTARGDKRGKASLYARAGVPELWIMDVQPRRLRVYRNAEDGAWPDPVEVRPGGRIAPLCAPEAAAVVPEL